MTRDRLLGQEPLQGRQVTGLDRCDQRRHIVRERHRQRPSISASMARLASPIIAAVEPVAIGISDLPTA